MRPEAAAQLQSLLTALEAEPAPPTTARAPERAIDVHVADSLSGLEVRALVEARRIADLGSGAGFPGLPLAIALADAQVDLIEATRRKAEVIERLAAAADVSNARAVAERAETWAAGEGHAAYDAVTARALAPLAVVLEYASPLLREGGTLVSWKGKRAVSEEESAAIAAGQVGMSPAAVLAVEPFETAGSRHLHVYRKTAPARVELPRRPGMARKRPLP